MTDEPTAEDVMFFGDSSRRAGHSRSSPPPARPVREAFPQRHAVRTLRLQVSADRRTLFYESITRRGAYPIGNDSGIVRAEFRQADETHVVLSGLGCLDLLDEDGKVVVRLDPDDWVPEAPFRSTGGRSGDAARVELMDRTGIPELLAHAGIPLEVLPAEGSVRRDRRVLDPFDDISRRTGVLRFLAQAVIVGFLTAFFVNRSSVLLLVASMGAVVGLVLEALPWVVGWWRERRTTHLLPDDRLRPVPAVPTRRAHQRYAFVAATPDDVVAVGSFPDEAWLPRRGVNGITQVVLPDDLTSSYGYSDPEPSVLFATDDGRVRLVLPVLYWFADGLDRVRTWADRNGLAVSYASPRPRKDNPGFFMADGSASLVRIGRGTRRGLPAAGLARALSGSIGSSYSALVLFIFVITFFGVALDSAVGAAGAVMLALAVVPRVVQMLYRRYLNGVVPPDLYAQRRRDRAGVAGGRADRPSSL